MTKKQTRSLGLNAIGKPYGANYDPNYRMNYKPSYAHLRWPYPFTMQFVGDPPNYDPNLRCFSDDRWWTAIMARAEEREIQRRKPRPKSKKENTAATLSWKENARKAEFTKRAPSGGRYILSPFLHCWNVDYCEKKSKERQQLGFAYTLDEAKAIAEADDKKQHSIMTEREILKRYSTPGLRRNELTRAGKKWHLYDMRKQYGWSADDIEKILDELYPQENRK